MKKLFIILFLIPFLSLSAQKFTLEFYGHACFQITTEEGVKILIDPVKLGNFTLPQGIEPDIVTISHNHRDHNNIKAVEGNPEIFYGLIAESEGKEIFHKVDTIIKNVHIYNIVGDHRDPNVTKMLNTMFVFEFDGLRIAHLGDQSILLNEHQIASIGSLDLLMIPIGGKYTIVPDQANQLIKELKVKHYVVPMHYKCDIAPFLPYSINDFLKGKSNIIEIEKNKMEISILSPSSDLKYIKMGYQ